MIRTIALVVFAFSTIAASTTRAQNVYSWICNIEGAPAELTAQVEAVNSAGVYMDPNGLFAGSVSLDQVIYYYQGSLVSQTGQYSFVGENEYADFTDLYTNQRFRVRMIVQGRELLMVVNPFGAQPAQYLCQMR